jgi:hypothetical protein
MIGALLVGSTFLILILIAVLYIAVSIRRWANIKDEELKEMNRKEITQLLKNISNILPNRNDKV